MNAHIPTVDIIRFLLNQVHLTGWNQTLEMSLLRMLTAIKAEIRRIQSTPKHTVARLYDGEVGVVTFSEEE